MATLSSLTHLARALSTPKINRRCLIVRAPRLNRADWVWTLGNMRPSAPLISPVCKPTDLCTSRSMRLRKTLESSKGEVVWSLKRQALKTRRRLLGDAGMIAVNLKAAKYLVSWLLSAPEFAASTCHHRSHCLQFCVLNSFQLIGLCASLCHYRVSKRQRLLAEGEGRMTNRQSVVLLSGPRIPTENNQEIRWSDDTIVLSNRSRQQLP